MSEKENSAPAANAAKQEVIVKLRPTLYIGLGGTGMEVMLRVRRRILSAIWGSPGHLTRLDTLANFPVAQFIHLDLDQAAVTETGKSQLTDPLAERVKLTDDDKLIERFDIERYSKSDDDLSKYPHIEFWSPLTPEKIRALAIDPSKGAGQIRAISRLYLFDKYPKIKDRLRSKLVSLKSGLSKDAQLKALDLDLDKEKFRIVIIASVAGGTGAGTFLDMGWLAKWQAKESVSSADVELMLFLPTGYQSANKERTEANGYASLMELETCMRGGAHFVEGWEAYSRPQLSDLPFDEVYLVDSGNLASQHLAPSDQNQVYDMVADTLFEDFASVDFANKKRSVAVNQRQHKIQPYSPPVPGQRYGDMRLSYYQGYSCFGQAMLDTQRQARRDLHAYRLTERMIKVFFGVSQELWAGEKRATDKQRDAFMAEFMYLEPFAYNEFPTLSDRKLRINRNEFTEFRLTERLQQDDQGSMIDGIQQKVAARLDSIGNNFVYNEWAAQIRETLRLLEHDVIRDQDSTADTTEDRISHRAVALEKAVMARLSEQMYSYLDNKEYGGLNYVITLVGQIKDRLENTSIGLIDVLAANAKRYAELRDAVRTHEYERLLDNLEQTGKPSLLFGGSNKEQQARIIIGQLKQEIGNYLKFHIRHKAAERASQLLKQLARRLGEQLDMDERGNPRWSGLVGELQTGRANVLAMMESANRKVELLVEDSKKGHATYIRVATPEDKFAEPSIQELRAWANDVFDDIGGSRKLFPILADARERENMIAKLRLRAEQQIANPDSKFEQQDPLVLALQSMSVNTRQRLFNDLLARAMPWVDANLDEDFRAKADQFKCYIGVNEPADYEPYKEELVSQIPSFIGLTPQQLAFVKTGIPGRAVCYCELSGIPLTILKGMPSWRTSYRKESEKIPLHTHRDSTKFTHPLVPSTSDLNSLANDFNQFLLAVMLGILVRDSRPAMPPGQYLFMVGPGDQRRIGNERAFRLNGFPPHYRSQIQERVAEQINQLDARQLCALAMLAHFFALEVYTRRLIADESGSENPVKGFSAAIAEEVMLDLRGKAMQFGDAPERLEQMERQALHKLNEWTTFIPDSDKDAYAWEIQPSSTSRLKRKVIADFFQAGWLANRLQTGDDSSLPPPLPTLNRYHVAFDGKDQGVFDLMQIRQLLAEKRIAGTTLVWCQGMADWQALQQVAELAAFVPAVPPPLPKSFD